MSPPFKKLPPDPLAPPRVGGYVTYRKPGQGAKRALIQWINPDNTMRVRPETGRATHITPADIARADKGGTCA